ncbi:serine hydrolase domain-containing protein [Aquimarina macrocephali]|uniref:serine hydrolase domain-containing protein n=1 Tax=Aquimarina macrocephali TaxID=666563 RepID=UPI003F6736B7
MKTSISGFIIILFISISCEKSDDPSTNKAQEFKTFLQNEMEKQHIPAMSVLVFKEDQILFEEYLGKSNIEKDNNLESDHLFLLASVSKLVVSTALLQLYDQGHFSLDENINEYLPFSVQVPNQAVPITFRILLTHTSGIRDNWDILSNQYYYEEDSPIVLDYYLENYLVAGGEYYNEEENFYDFEPGSNFRYSNTGNALIAVLIEAISGIDFNTYCKQHIFSPLGMVNTFWRYDEISQPIVQPYHYIDGKYQAIPHYTFTDYPNGGLRSNVRDMHKLLTVFVLNGRSNNHQLLQSETIIEMLTPQIPNLYGQMGLHVFYLDDSRNLWGHSGGNEGVATIVAFNPESKIEILLFTNNWEIKISDIYRKAYDLGTDL